MVCVFQGKEIHERFHRQDFFFINYAYSGDYGAQSYRFDHPVTIRENECYIGQPFSGYALYGAGNKDIVIIGVLIRKEVFYRSFLQTVSADRRLLHFFLDPKINSFSDEFIHLENLQDGSIRTQIELMAAEYANKNAGTQAILKPMPLRRKKIMIREILLLGDPKLYETSTEVTEADVPRIAGWVTDLHDTLMEYRKVHAP